MKPFRFEVESLPSSDLNPNSRAHFRKKIAAKQKLSEAFYEGICVAFAEQQDTEFEFPWHRVAIWVDWKHSFHIKPDADNALAMLKAGFDELAKNGVITDDRHAIYPPIKFERVAKGDERLIVIVLELCEGECPMCGNLCGGDK